jgi:hypothetical protein
MNEFNKKANYLANEKSIFLKLFTVHSVYNELLGWAKKVRYRQSSL